MAEPLVLLAPYEAAYPLTRLSVGGLWRNGGYPPHSEPRERRNIFEIRSFDSFVD